ERRVLARDVFLDGRELDVRQGAVDVQLFVRFADFQRGGGKSETAECNCGDEAFHGVLPRLVDRYCIRHYFRRRRPRGRVTQGSAYSNRNPRASTAETMQLIGAAYLWVGGLRPRTLDRQGGVEEVDQQLAIYRAEARRERLGVRPALDPDQALGFAGLG